MYKPNFVAFAFSRRMNKPNFVILTGGPGGGKTSVLSELQRCGFRYVKESAREIIRKRIGAGLSPRPAPKDFANEIFQMDYALFQSERLSADLLFFDRSMLDSAGMIKQADERAYNSIKDLLASHRYNPKVFVTPPWWEIYRNDAERDQTFEQAVEVYDWLCEWYRDNDYTLFVLPKASIPDRVKFILVELGIAP